MPLDLAPFEASIPPSVRALVDEARDGRGLAARWLEIQDWQITDECWRLFRETPRPTDQQLGWLTGITTFFEDFRRVDACVASVPGTAPFVLEAFAAGLRGGVPTRPHQWEAMERIAALLPEVPDPLVEELARGLASDLALERAPALRIARKAGPRARTTIERHRGGDKKRDRLLTAALEALTPDETPRDDLLARLLSAWAETFDPALVPLIVERGAEEARARGPLAGKSKAEVENAWFTLAERRDPGDVDRLLGTPWPGAWKLALRRLEALMKFPSDPRIADAMPDISAPYVSWGAQAARRAASSLASRMLGPQRASAPASLLAEARFTAKPTVDLDAAWRGFHEDPGSDDRRLVLADALQAAGDPRGEFIALSYAKKDAAVRKRFAQLLDVHIDAWSGGLPGVVRASRRFERGFLSAVQLKPRDVSLAGAAESEAWETLEELHVDAFLHRTAHFEALGRLLERARLLRTYVHHGLGASSILTDLTGTFPHVTGLAVSWGKPDGPLPAFPSLALLGMADEPIETALEVTQRANASILLLFGVVDLTGAIRALDASKVTEARFVTSGRFAMEHRGFCVQVFGGSQRARLSWGSGRCAEGVVRAHLEALAATGRTRVSIAMPRSVAVEKELAGFPGLVIETHAEPLSIFRA